MTIDLNDAVTLTTQVHDTAGNIVQATGASPAITLTVTDPTANVSTPSVTYDAPSLTYSATFTVATPGLWSYEWQTFGTYRGVDPGQFLVESHDPTQGSDTLGTLEGWQTWRGQPFTTTELPRAMMTLRTAMSLLTAETGYTFTEVTAGTYTADGGHRIIFLPQWPVNSITSVAFDGVDSTSWEFLPTIGAIRSTGWWFGFPFGHQNIVITYDYGYATLPPNVQSLVYMIASRLFANPTGENIQSETLGSYSVSYAPTAGGGLTETEQGLAGSIGWPIAAF
jgi:hypothetical protein